MQGSKTSAGAAAGLLTPPPAPWRPRLGTAQLPPPAAARCAALSPRWSAAAAEQQDRCDGR